MSRSHYDRCLALALSVQNKEKGEERAPGARAAGLVSWIGEEGSRRLNGSAVERDVLRWGLGRVATSEEPSVAVFAPRRSGRRQASPGSVLPQRGAAPRGSTNPSCESRPAEPGASRYVVSIRIDSSIADFDSWHRVRSSRWNGLGREVGEVTHDARLCDPHVRKGCGVSSIQNQGMGEMPCPLTRVARVEIRCASAFHGRPYPGRAWACSPGEVGLTTRLLLDLEARRSSPVSAKHI